MTEATTVVGSRSTIASAKVRRIVWIVAGVIVGLGVLLVVASVVEHTYYSGSVLPGVRLDGMHIGGRKDAQVRAAIEQMSKQLDAEPVRAHAGKQTFVVDPSLIGFSVDVDATVRAVQDAGRRPNAMGLVGDTVLRRFRADDVDLVVHYDENRFEGVLDGWTNALQTGLVEGNLRFQGTTVVAVEPHSGRGLQRDDAEHALRQMLAGRTRIDLDLPIGPVDPQTGQAAVDAALARARSILTGDFVIVAGTTHVTLTSAQIAPTLGTNTNRRSLDLTIDSEKLRFVLAPAFGAVELPPVDATWNISNANSVIVVPSRDGRQLDLQAVGASILRDDRAITASITDEHPAHDTAWARALGITHQVSSFTTYYLSGEPRVHNIHLAADTLNNTVVTPGQTFSLNAKLGQRTPEKGYVQAPIEVEDGFGQDYGGGISQLTTTLFNAIFFGGYVDVDHSPHHYYVSRYPLGREATIVWPYVDLKFRNDSKHGVLIRTSYSNTSITVTFYGDTDGRVATETNRKILHTEPVTDKLIPCPVANPALDPNNSCPKLLPGEHDTISTGETGYDVEFDRLITQPGGPPVQTRYHVHYPMLQNSVLVGNAAGNPPSPTTVPKPSPTPTPVGHAPTTTRSNPTPATVHR